MANKKDISSEILQHIIDSGSENISVENDSFWQTVMRGSKQQLPMRIARLIGLVFVAIASIVFVLYSAVFYIQDVLLYKADLKVNQFGTFIRKSYNSEYAMFLFDSSELWAASGVQVQKGDRLFISASGAFHTDIYQLINAANSNQWADLREQFVVKDSIDALNLMYNKMYRYIHMSSPPTKFDPLHPFAIDTLHRRIQHPQNLKNTALFGDVLFQVAPEYLMRDTLDMYYSSVYAIPRVSANRYKKSMRILQDGVLSFCVNDDNPYNNIGQVLVVMEIYRKHTWEKAIENLFCKGQLLDFPYYWYDYWKHKGYLFVAILIFLLCTFCEYSLLCVLCYCLPFLFLKQTWQNLWKSCRKINKMLTTMLMTFHTN